MPLKQPDRRLHPVPTLPMQYPCILKDYEMEILEIDDELGERKMLEYKVI